MAALNRLRAVMLQLRQTRPRTALSAARPLLRHPVNQFFTPSTQSIALIPPPSPQDADRLTVVLDMDECLLHSAFEAVDTTHYDGDLHRSPLQAPDSPSYTHPVKGFKYDLTFVIGSTPLDMERVFVRFRPHLHIFLTSVSQRYEPILFTSAMQIYAEPILNYLDNQWKVNVRHRLYRPSTVSFKGVDYVKDIRRLRGNDSAVMSKTVLIDNSPMAQIAAPDNAITVPEFIDDDNDNHLLQLLKLLERMEHEYGSSGDIRPWLMKNVRFREFWPKFYPRVALDPPAVSTTSPPESSPR